MTGNTDYRMYLEEKFGEINTKLDSIDKQVKITNGRVTELEKWRAGCEGSESQKNRSFSKTLQILGFIVAFMMLIVTVFYKMNKTEQTVKNIVDQYGFNMVTRGAVRDTI